MVEGTARGIVAQDDSGKRVKRVGMEMSCFMIDLRFPLAWCQCSAVAIKARTVQGILYS